MYKTRFAFKKTVLKQKLEKKSKGPDKKIIKVYFNNST